MKTNRRTGKCVTRISTDQLKATSRRELTAMRQRMLRNDIDTSDIPESRVGGRKPARRAHGSEHG